MLRPVEQKSHMQHFKRVSTWTMSRLLHPSFSHSNTYMHMHTCIQRLSIFYMHGWATLSYCYTQAHICSHIYTYMQSCIHVCITLTRLLKHGQVATHYVYIHIRIRTHACIHAHIICQNCSSIIQCARTHTHTYTHTWIPTHAYHTHTHTHKHTHASVCSACPDRSSMGRALSNSQEPYRHIDRTSRTLLGRTVWGCQWAYAV